MDQALSQTFSIEAIIANAQFIFFPLTMQADLRGLPELACAENSRINYQSLTGLRFKT